MSRSPARRNEKESVLMNSDKNKASNGTRIAILSIIVSEDEIVDNINSLLHDYGNYIVGRLGLPYRDHGVNIICVVLDATNDVISSLSGKIGRLRGVSAKVTYSNL